MIEGLPKAETGGGGGEECSKPTVERREGKRDERSTGTRAEQRAGGLQGISSSDRAALLSARIHREINTRRDWPPYGVLKAFFVSGREWADLLWGYEFGLEYFDEHLSFYRLGAELRAIALGNRGTP